MKPTSERDVYVGGTFDIRYDLKERLFTCVTSFYYDEVITFIFTADELREFAEYLIAIANNPLSYIDSSLNPT